VTIPTTAASPWPARCAYLSASIFIGASGATNVVYGWSKGDTFAASLVWAGVAGAVAIVFALSWPALIRSVDAKRWSAALIALVAMLLSGAYSVTAALGSAAGGRANAAATETATTDARTKAQVAYDTALTTSRRQKTTGALLWSPHRAWLRSHRPMPALVAPHYEESSRGSRPRRSPWGGICHPAP